MLLNPTNRSGLGRRARAGDADHPHPRQPLGIAEVARRIDRCRRPCHEALSRLIDEPIGAMAASFT